MPASVIENVSPLAANAVYTSGARDMEEVFEDLGPQFVNYHVEVDSDQNGTVEVDQSTDLLVWNTIGQPSTYNAGSGVLVVTQQVTQRYVRSKFTNGSTAQGRFTMTTSLTA